MDAVEEKLTGTLGLFSPIFFPLVVWCQIYRIPQNLFKSNKIEMI